MWLFRVLGVRADTRRPSRRRSALAAPRIVDAALHVDSDAICPDCLEWIGPGDFVRRNAFGIVEHEVCPPSSVRQHSR
jgi:hypothetical protein